MTITNFQSLWDNHPGLHKFPCDESAFRNQCAIRMGVALEASGYSTASFDLQFKNRRCWFHRSSPHILAAHELASWMKASKATFGDPKIFQSSNIAERYEVKGKKGVVYINNGWGPTDHIDLWDGKRLKAGSTSYLDRGNQLWFWEAK